MSKDESNCPYCGEPMDSSSHRPEPPKTAEEMLELLRGATGELLNCCYDGFRSDEPIRKAQRAYNTVTRWRAQYVPAATKVIHDIVFNAAEDALVVKTDKLTGRKRYFLRTDGDE